MGKCIGTLWRSTQLTKHNPLMLANTLYDQAWCLKTGSTRGATIFLYYRLFEALDVDSTGIFTFRSLAQKLGESGNCCPKQRFIIHRLGILDASFSLPFPLLHAVPEQSLGIAQLALQPGTLARTPLRRSVVVWSSNPNTKTRFYIACLGISDLLEISHNPEVVGSNPASATN